MTRKSKVMIVPCCDYCPQDRDVTASGTCAVCGKDLCRSHGFPIPIPIPRLGVPEAIRKKAYGTGLLMQLSMLYEIQTVCPECVGSTTISEIISVLQARGK